MKLYDAIFPGTRGSRVRWMLEELGIHFDVVTVDPTKGEHKAPEYLARHPHGLIPAAELDGESLIESAAICMQLADKHPEKGLAPALGTAERARWYQFIVYAVATLDEPMVSRLFHTALYPEPKRDPKVVEKADKVWAHAGPFLERSLTGRDFLLGNVFSAADVVLGYDLVMASRMGLLADCPNLQKYVARLMEREAFKRVYG